MEIQGAGGAIVKTGNGNLAFTGPNSYTGVTTVSGGTLALTGTGEIDESIEITVGAGAIFSVSGRTGGGYSYGGEISGDGSVLGNPTLTASGDLQPGGNLGNDVGTLTVSGNTALGGTYAFQINGGTGADLLQANGTVNVTGEA
ncbi:MAG: autotransporter-associated beta strand repeat-containing protein [Verrucomicrobiales bacterium]